jgi:hypothetical protein
VRILRDNNEMLADVKTLFPLINDVCAGYLIDPASIACTYVSRYTLSIRQRKVVVYQYRGYRQRVSIGSTIPQLRLIRALMHARGDEWY